MAANSDAFTSSTQDPNVAFEVGDASTSDKFYTHPGQAGVPYNLVFAAFLLNYASSRENLLAFCKTIYANLDPERGALVTLNSCPLQPFDTFDQMTKYGYRKRFGPDVDTSKPVPSYTPFMVEAFTNVDDPAAGAFEFTNYHITMEEYFECLKEAGFKSVRLVPLEASEQKEFLQDFVDWQPAMVIEALV